MSVCAKRDPRPAAGESSGCRWRCVSVGRPAMPPGRLRFVTTEASKAWPSRHPPGEARTRVGTRMARRSDRGSGRGVHGSGRNGPSGLIDREIECAENVRAGLHPSPLAIGRRSGAARTCRTDESAGQAPSGRRFKRWERGGAMELWQMDVVGRVLLADGRQCKVLTGIDGSIPGSSSAPA